jgi:hypothetical protein
VQVATFGYGVANWYLYNSEHDKALSLFKRILDGPGWAAFGYIAAETDLQAQRGAPSRVAPTHPSAAAS